MSEANEKLVSNEETEQFNDADLRSESFRIAFDYLVGLRGSEDKDLTLKKIHNTALKALVKDDDYHNAVSYHREAFGYLERNAKMFGIKVK